MAKAEVKEYSKEIEEMYIRFLVTSPDLFVRCLSILDHMLFHDGNCSRVIEFLIDYVEQHNVMPSVDIIKANTKQTIELMSPGDAVKHESWFLSDFENFCRHRALERAILTSPDLLEQGRYGEVESKIKQAVQIGLVKDLGTDYFNDPYARLEVLKNRDNMVSTGWKDIDHKLYGGFNRGELTIFCGQSGAGKSLFLQNLAINWAVLGLNVVYITLELSENLCAMRLDAMTSGYETRDILKNTEDVAMRVKSFQKKHKGTVRLKYMPSGSTTNDIRAYIKEYEIQSGIKVDGILVDYLDLCSPVSVKVSPSDQFIKDKYVSEELRNMAAELNVLFSTASQLNRTSYEEIEFDPSHIAGGISKVNTADNVIGIFTTAAMKEAGRYQIQFMKTRSSSGVGSKVDLAFNPKTLRIFDLDDGEDGAVGAQTKNIMETLRKKSVVNSKSEEDEPTRSTSDTANKATALRSLVKKMQ
jgi:KaiC/GvpD/RAD55 family RecA-like ATPase